MQYADRRRGFGQRSRQHRQRTQRHNGRQSWRSEGSGPRSRLQSTQQRAVHAQRTVSFFLLVCVFVFVLCFCVCRLRFSCTIFCKSFLLQPICVTNFANVSLNTNFHYHSSPSPIHHVAVSRNKTKTATTHPSHCSEYRRPLGTIVLVQPPATQRRVPFTGTSLAAAAVHQIQRRRVATVAEAAAAVRSTCCLIAAATVVPCRTTQRRAPAALSYTSRPLRRRPAIIRLVSRYCCSTAPAKRRPNRNVAPSRRPVLPALQSQPQQYTMNISRPLHPSVMRPPCGSTNSAAADAAAVPVAHSRSVRAAVDRRTAPVPHPINRHTNRPATVRRPVTVRLRRVALRHDITTITISMREQQRRRRHRRRLVRLLSHPDSHHLVAMHCQHRRCPLHLRQASSNCRRPRHRHHHRLQHQRSAIRPTRIRLSTRRIIDRWRFAYAIYRRDRPIRR